ncbi:MAG TPA: DUF4352 domain-containing protein [Candidatus Dormibacteraeota bacterium]|nr:DUF4352 domain-containing protein [Candidatus Dormibacteraeota bacterium]
MRHQLKMTGLAWAAALAAASVAGCGALTQSAPTVKNSTPAVPVPTATPNSLEGPVGTTFTDTDSQGNKITVTMTGVIDPAQGTAYETPNNGYRFVAVQFTIVGVSGNSSDDANSNATVIGSDTQTYTADFNSVAGCTNFNYGQYSVAAGQTNRGCVTFQLPNGVTVAHVEWGAGFGGAPAIWDVP